MIVLSYTLAKLASYYLLTGPSLVRSKPRETHLLIIDC